MIITKTPLRISFAGGGTDLQCFYKKDFGAVTSFTINKYVKVKIRNSNDCNIKFKYDSVFEKTDNVDMISNQIVREGLKLFNITGGIDIESICDVPSGTGLGSSSSFAVGLIYALSEYTGKDVDAKWLAEKACELEIEILNKPIGKQDQYASAFGGCNYLKFNADESVNVLPIQINRKQERWIKEELLLFYTGIQRSADLVLSDQQSVMSEKSQELIYMRNQASIVKEIFLENQKMDRIGLLLDKGWKYKKALSKKISNDVLDEYYARAVGAGAIGGKITGAGGGGMLMVCCKKSNTSQVRNALKELEEIKFEYCSKGSVLDKI